MGNNRFYERVDCRVSFECKFYYDPQGHLLNFRESVDFEVYNVSVGGILAVSKQDVPMEAVLEYTFYLDQVPYVVMSRIKWKKAEGDGYQYGMEFLTISNMMYRHLKAYTSRMDFLGRAENVENTNGVFSPTTSFE